MVLASPATKPKLIIDISRHNLCVIKISYKHNTAVKNVMTIKFSVWLWLIVSLFRVILTSQVLHMSHIPGKVTESEMNGINDTYLATFSCKTYQKFSTVKILFADVDH